jgi:putative transcriptional regulator
MRNEVRQLRAGRALSQQALGMSLGVSRQTINAIEQGRYDPSLPLAIKMARFFGLAVEEVFHVDGEAR